MTPRIDLAHAITHSLGGKDPLDAFLDTTSAQSATGQKAFSIPPILGTGPSLGSHMVWRKYPISVSGVGSHPFTNIFSSFSARAGGSMTQTNTIAYSSVVSVRAGGSATLTVSPQSTGAQS